MGSMDAPDLIVFRGPAADHNDRARDLDPAEQDAVADGRLALVAPGPDLPARLASEVGAGPVFVHVDCDVLEPGAVATDYAVPGGLTLDELRDAAGALAGVDVLGLEVAEYEGPAASTAEDVVRALAGLVH